MKILITDDDPISRAVLTGIFAQHPEHQVTLANDGKEAWALLDDPGRYFDVVFLDINMPVLDGLTLMKRIFAAPLLRSVEVVLGSDSKDRATITRAIQAGAKHYLVKPFTEEVILAKLKQLEEAAADGGGRRR